MDYCDVFISCLDSHSDGTHSLQRIHWWASNAKLHFYKSKNTKKHEETNSSTYLMAWVFTSVNVHFGVNYYFKALVAKCIYTALYSSVCAIVHKRHVSVVLCLHSSTTLQMYNRHVTGQCEHFLHYYVWTLQIICISRPPYVTKMNKSVFKYGCIEAISITRSKHECVNVSQNNRTLCILAPVQKNIQSG